MTVRHFGIIHAKIDPQARRVVLSIKRGPGKLPDSTIPRVLDWALAGCADLVRDGYEIDKGGVESFFTGDNRN